MGHLPAWEDVVSCGRTFLNVTMTPASAMLLNRKRTARQPNI